MTLSRRRFLSISAAAITLPQTARASATWHGRAFGAEVAITIHGPRDQADAALQAARDAIIKTERLFSLYDPASELSQLNRDGSLSAPSPWFSKLMRAADAAFVQSGGLFDPTVQPLWRALFEGHDPATALGLIDWSRVTFDTSKITLGMGQALTFNGIAQGFATDRVTDILQAKGLTRTLVNIGEYRGIGGPWTLGISDPVHGRLGQRSVTNCAIATSSPAATPLGRDGHILHPIARPQWSSVTVEAQTATQADSLSTAMVLATRDQIEGIASDEAIKGVTLIDFDGDLTTL